MRENPVVLVLVNNADRREAVRQRLLELDVLPITVRAARATEAVSYYHPIAALIDEAHAATAPDEFLEASCANRMRLVTLPEPDVSGLLSDAALLNAVTPRPSL